MQYGYTTSVSNVVLTYDHCEFKRNKCTYGSGGALAINIENDLTITDCLFEDNHAKDNAGAIYFYSKIEKPADNPNAPNFDGNVKTKLITITNCQFKGNSASNGHAIYVGQYHSLENAKLLVTGCTFADNGESNYTIYTQAGELDFSSNTVQNNDKTKSSGILQIPEGSCKSALIDDSNFINCNHNQQFSFEIGNPKFTLTNCHFTNFKTSGHIVNFVGDEIKVNSCDFSFDNNKESCGAIKVNSHIFSLQNTNFLKTNAEGAIKFEQKSSTENKEVLIEKYLFDQCLGSNVRCFDISIYTVQFTFQDIVLQNLQESGNKGYFIGINCNNGLKTLALINVTFQNNRCNSDYGGGSGIWFINVETIKFDNCKFINNHALKSPNQRDKIPTGATEISYYSGDGGAIQYGFSNSIYNVNMEFNGCEFTNNKAVRHGGALALQTVKDVTIVGCTFKNNVANDNEGSAKLLEYTNYFSKKTYGRGGSIYLNPAFNHEDMEDKSLHMNKVTINNNIFEENSAYDGHAIYIQGEDPGTTFDIKNNQFKNNVNKGDQSLDTAVIFSEIHSIELHDSNVFTYSQEAKPMSINFGNPEDTEFDGPDYFEFVNITTHGRHDYIVSDNSKLIVSVILSYFHDINSNKDGGALYIKNAGLACNEITFVRCSSEGKKGEAIYIYNDYANTSYANIVSCNISNCHAAVGGGLFIYSNNEVYVVTVRNCSFTENKATATKATGSLFGGSGAFIAAKRGKIKKNTFTENIGEGNALRLTNDFASVSPLLSQNNMKLIVSENKFIIFNSESGAVFYTRGKGGPLIEMSECIFEGKLDEGRRFIEGERISNVAPKMIVKNCKFTSDSSSAIQLDSDFLTVDLNQQVFDSENAGIEMKSVRKSQKKSALAVVLVAATVSVAIVVGFAIFFTKKVKNNDSDDNEMQSDDNSI